MKCDDPQADNLLSRVFSYAPRSGGRETLEDFCTEALAWCLRNSEEFKLTFLKSLKAIPESLFKDPNQLEIETQACFSADQDSNPKAGRFDLIIRSTSNDFILVFENKVNSDFGDTQIPRYSAELKKRLDAGKCRKSFLVALTKYAVPKQYEKYLDARPRWSDVHGMLQEATRKMTAAGANQLPVRFGLTQVADFLKSRGMYFMQIPKTTKIDSLAKGISFCHAIQQILVQAASDLDEVRGSTVHLKEYNKGKELWIEIGNFKSLYLAFQIVPIYRLLVGTYCTGKRRKPTHTDFNIDEFNPWNGGFEFYGEFAEMDGNADQIRNWFEKATRQAIKTRDGD